jgi:hypothetical protein
MPSSELVQPVMTGVHSDSIPRIIKVLTGLKVFTPSKDFRSSSDAKGTHTHSVKCSLKAASGSLYFFEKSFFFLPKPTAYLRTDPSSLSHVCAVRDLSV